MRTLTVLVALLITIPVSANQPARGPNVVVIFCDDLGYADVSCYGGKGAPTPNVDKLAAEGVRFTDFYVSQAVCSASRAALLTGCYNLRVGIAGALGPQSKIGLNPAETNLATLFKSKGYSTGIFGKWHLGSAPNLRPERLGFDEFCGVLTSHDMWPKHPVNPKAYPDLPLYAHGKIVATNPDPDTLTRFYHNHAITFIEKNKDRPFFLYLPHSLPHVPLGAGPDFKGKSAHGLYGDVMTEIDWSVGQVMATLKKHGLDENTLVMFSSDNGPWMTYGDHAGSAGPLREAKGTSFDGGVRVPAIFRWPGRIAAGKVCAEPAMTIDVLPTLAHLLGAELPKDRKIDGANMWSTLAAGQRPADAPPLHEALFIYWGERLDAVRSGKWKLHFPHDYRMTPAVRATGGKPQPDRKGTIELSLFDLEADPSESTDLSAKHPDVVRRLTALADVMRQDLGDSATGAKGSGRRPPGRAE
ncbi:MAG TPA: sulfatase [Tepidisphaeraceae bacterium]|nr:sulfatase [Tepidisphaeraceae bacterium]